MDFQVSVLTPIRQHLGNPNITVPLEAVWEVDDTPDGLKLTLTLDARKLSLNMQESHAAAPTYLWCLAYWLEKATNTTTCCEVKVVGPAPTLHSKLQHWRRSQFILQGYVDLLGQRFSCSPPPSWSWPTKPVINAPQGERGSQKKGDPLSEHNLEVQIADTPALKQSFSDHVADLAFFRRQLPLGLFGGKVSKATAWTPGGLSQVDLWGTSSDEKTLHIFELKTVGNAPLGIIPEAFYYGRLLHHIRVGLSGERPIKGNGDGFVAARKADHIVVWLTAPRLHPLVSSHDDSPLCWLNKGLAGQGLEFRILPFNLSDDNRIEWKHQEIWPKDRRLKKPT